MSKELDFSAHRNCVCFNLRRVTRVVTQFFDAEMRRHGIRSTQGTLLAALHSTGKSTMAELSEILGMERTTLLRNLRPLQRDGLVAIEGGGRGGPVELSLTAKGRKQIEKLSPAWESAREALACLGVRPTRRSRGARKGALVRPPCRSRCGRFGPEKLRTPIQSDADRPRCAYTHKKNKMPLPDYPPAMNQDNSDQTLRTAQPGLVGDTRPTQPSGTEAAAPNAAGKPWVLITGASSGFGEEFARQYAELGHPLVLVARRLDRLQALAETLQRRHGTQVLVEQVDLSDIAAVVRLYEGLGDKGIEIDVLINNAGHGLQGPFADTPLDAALAMVQLDIASLTAVTHVFAQGMRKRRRGEILLVASLLASQGVENFAVYSAAKAYVLRLGEALHREFKREGLAVTTLCPGLSDTGFAQAAGQKITPLLKFLMMKPAPVVRAGIRALRARRLSVVPGWANKVVVAFTWATPRRLHQAVMSRTMNG
jgi:uncharacterized protein